MIWHQLFQYYQIPSSFPNIKQSTLLCRWFQEYIVGRLLEAILQIAEERLGWFGGRISTFSCRQDPQQKVCARLILENPSRLQYGNYCFRRHRFTGGSRMKFQATALYVQTSWSIITQFSDTTHNSHSDNLGWEQIQGETSCDANDSECHEWLYLSFHFIANKTTYNAVMYDRMHRDKK